MRVRCVCAVAALLLAGCASDDALGPQDFTGTWLSASREGNFGLAGPDTLVLDGRGGGRIALRRHWTTGAEQPELVWTAGAIRYRFSGRDVLLSWCPAPAGWVADCIGGWHYRGRFGRDGMLWIGPTSPISSASAQPWRRAPAAAFVLR